MKNALTWALGGGLALALVLSSCSSSVPEAPADSDEGSPAALTLDVTPYREAAKAAMAPVNDWPGPTSGPGAVPGAKIMWLACGLSAEGCKVPADAAVEAGEVLGWEVRVVDGQFDPKVYNRAVLEAVDQGYDAVILDAVSVEAVAESVKTARAAGLIVGSWDGGNAPAPDGVTFEVEYPVYEQGVALANYLIWKTGGKANAYLTDAPEFHLVMEWVQGARDTFEACETCTVARTDQFTAGEVATRVPTMITSALRADPEINVVVGGYDAAILAAVPSIRSAGFDTQLIGSFNAIQPMTQFIRDGQVSASVAEPFAWGAWATFDNVNRILAGQDPVDQGIPFRLITADNIGDIESNTNWSGDVDFKSQFTKIWAKQ